MSSIVRSGGGSAVARMDERIASRQISRINSQTDVGLAVVEQQAMLQVARADAVAYVGRAGMQAVAMVSQFEAQLGQVCPMAVTRLQGIADMTALGIAEVVADTVAKVTR